MLSRFVPSMFLRRLLLIGGAFAVAFGSLAVSATRQAVTDTQGMLDAVESRLVRQEWVETVRGRVLDRRGRVLARDAPSWDVLVDYRVLTGEADWSRAAKAVREAHEDEWDKVSRHQREQWIRDTLPAFERETAGMWRELARVTGTPIDDLDERTQRIVRTVQRRAGTIWDIWYEQRRAELNRERSTAVELDLADVAKPIEEQAQPHVLIKGIDQPTMFRVASLAERFEGLMLAPSGLREYPYETITIAVDTTTLPEPLREAHEGAASVTVEGVGTHLLGWMRPHTAEDVERHRADPDRDDRQAYRSGDLVGSSGIEAAFEPRLRGKRGVVRTRLDLGTSEIIEPEPGHDLALTIDIMLQARVQAALGEQLGLGVSRGWHNSTRPEGTPLNGAAVVIEVSSGEVLAMVSTPSFTRAELEKSPERIFGDPVRTPFVNRAIDTPYAPGSVMKPIVLNMAVASGQHDPARRIEDNGMLDPEHPDRFRDWYWREYGLTHSGLIGGPLSGDEAIGRSSNVFFYTLGRAMGPDRMREWLLRFGIDEPRASEASPIVGEKRTSSVGQLGLPAFTGTAGIKRDGTPTLLGDAIMMGIGQGPIEWTPVHAADAYATIARGGVRLWPRIVRTDRVRGVDLDLDPRAVSQALEGLGKVIHWEYGTARHLPTGPGRHEPIFNVPGVRVIGKSGTAQIPVLRYTEIDDAGNERRASIGGTNAWFVALAGPEGQHPTHAIAVIMERAGSGTRVSAPIVNQIVAALRAEGYL